jgi:hypothetical protein
VTITDRMAARRRERRVLQRVSRAVWRLEQAERERRWALASTRAEGGLDPLTVAAAVGFSPARVHRITAGAVPDGLGAALGELRAAGWPAPEDPGGDGEPGWTGATRARRSARDSSRPGRGTPGRCAVPRAPARVGPRPGELGGVFLVTSARRSQCR